MAGRNVGERKKTVPLSETILDSLRQIGALKRINKENKTMTTGDRVHIIQTNSMGMIAKEFDATYDSLQSSGYALVVMDDGNNALVRPCDIRTPRVVAETESVMCDCGHSVHAESVMHASIGSSCPDCYDRLSY